MFGLDGGDTLTGGTGADRLTGGAGRDTFRFFANDMPFGEDVQTDLIVDFSRAQRDRIDLSQIDGDRSTIVKDAFTFIGQTAFHGVAGELRYFAQGDTTIVQGDTDRNGFADFALTLTGVLTLRATDFLLGDPAMHTSAIIMTPPIRADAIELWAMDYLF